MKYLIVVIFGLIIGCSNMQIIYVDRSQIGGHNGVYWELTQTAYIANDMTLEHTQEVIRHERKHHLFGSLGEVAR